MIKLFELPIPESYKPGRMVMEAVLGRALTDKPVLSFSDNAVLSVLRTIDTAGQELTMDFVGKMVHTLCLLGTYFVHTS
jgi:hypothetical protein